MVVCSWELNDMNVGDTSVNNFKRTRVSLPVCEHTVRLKLSYILFTRGKCDRVSFTSESLGNMISLALCLPWRNISFHAGKLIQNSLGVSDVSDSSLR